MGEKVFRIASFAVIFACTICMCACGKQSEENLEHVTYRLKWLFNASVVGDLYADLSGIFAAHGLEVSVKEGGPERDPIKELELGHSQFGVASADQVIRARSKGAPVVVIAQLFQENPFQWIFRPQKVAIKTVQDLRGKTIGVTFGGNDETIMKALMAKYKISNDEVRLFSVRYDYTPFYQGEVDLWPVYQNAQGIVIGEKLRKAGEEISFFRPSDFGIQFVANSIITTQQMSEERPRLVQQFLGALLQGWREALDPINSEKAVGFIHKFDRDTPVDLIRKQLKATRTLVKPGAEIEIGSIDVKAWAQTEKIMLAQKLVDLPVLEEGILRRDFLDGVVKSQ
jgi:NitT/TauT family transport system substrate-binding protein